MDIEQLHALGIAVIGREHSFLCQSLQQETAQRTQVDVRIVSATHCNLTEMVAQGGFREDLFYRLNMLRLRIPPLFYRPDDIPLLLPYFAIATCRQY